MNPLLFAYYCCIIVFTVSLMSVIIKYYHQKPTNNQFIRDRIETDLAAISCAGVCFMSALFIGREIFGPFRNVHIVELVLLTQQVIKCIVKHQL